MVSSIQLVPVEPVFDKLTGVKCHLESTNWMSTSRDYLPGFTQTQTVYPNSLRCANDHSVPFLYISPHINITLITFRKPQAAIIHNAHSILRLRAKRKVESGVTLVLSQPRSHADCESNNRGTCITARRPVDRHTLAETPFSCELPGYQRRMDCVDFLTRRPSAVRPPVPTRHVCRLLRNTRPRRPPVKVCRR